MFRKQQFIKNIIWGSDEMKLIVGLGNPGIEYQNTRHNIGFMMLDSYASSHNFTFSKTKYNGMYAEIFFGSEKVIFLKPLSYMNLSGEVVRKFVDYYHIDVQDLLIIHDDLDLPFGKIKVKPSGSSGGHNGLKNIEFHLNTQNYKRFKIGISNNKQINTKDYVLGKFSREELEEISHLAIRVSEMIDAFLAKDFSDIMNQYNRKS